MIDQPVPVPVYEFCDESAPIVTKLTEGEHVRVVSSLAGGTQTCYKVRVKREGVVTEGYVIGPVLPEISAYVAARQTDLRAGRFVQPAQPAVVEPAKPAEPSTKPEAAAPPPPPKRPVPTVPNSKVT
jgi:hypothetical protein